LLKVLAKIVPILLYITETEKSSSKSCGDPIS